MIKSNHWQNLPSDTNAMPSPSDDESPPSGRREGNVEDEHVYETHPEPQHVDMRRELIEDMQARRQTMEGGDEEAGEGNDRDP